MSIFSGKRGAQWATWPEIIESSPYHLIDESRDSLILGQHENGEVIGFKGSQSLCIISGAGGGKTTSFILPSLIWNTDTNALVLDIKPSSISTEFGELYQHSAKNRQEAGHKTVVYNPLSANSATYNFLEHISPERYHSDLSMLSAVFLPITDGGESAQWIRKARPWLTFFFEEEWFRAKLENRLPSISRVMDNVFDDMEHIHENIIKGSLLEINEAFAPYNYDLKPLMRLSGDIVTVMRSDKTYASVMSYVTNALEVFMGPTVERSVSGKSDFSHLDLMGADKITLYLTIQETEHYGRLLAVILEQLVSNIMRDKISDRREAVLDLYLDEVASLGPSQTVEKLLSRGRGFGLRAILAYQSISQIAKYESAGLVLDNVLLRAFLAPSSDTAEQVSKELGSVRNIFTGDTEEPLATAYELSQGELSNKLVLLGRKHPPIQLRPLPYWEAFPEEDVA